MPPARDPRLLPHEVVRWSGRRAAVSRDPRWTLGPAVLSALAAIFVLFGGLLRMVELPGAEQTLSLAALLSLAAIAVFVAPQYLHDPAEYLVTNRRVLWRRGRYERAMDAGRVSFARIHWHRSEPGVGHLELVRAVPFGPFARSQRLVFLDVRDPERVLGLVRGAELVERAGDLDLPLAERLDVGERVVWGGHPEGLLLGWREVATAALGLATAVAAWVYGDTAFGVLASLEDRGLPVRSWAWGLLFAAIATTFVLIAAIGLGLLWYGLLRARTLGRGTEYVLTDRRLLIRRGRTELSLDRARIVDVADAPARGGLHHLFLLLDAPESRALADSGALGRLTPGRDSVPPVLFELREVEHLKGLLLREDKAPTEE